MCSKRTLPSPERFKSLADDISDLYARKNTDYGNSFHDTYQKFGIVSALTRISDKFNRLCQLAMSNEQKVADEKLEDTLKDLASYSLMLIMELEQERNHVNA